MSATTFNNRGRWAAAGGGALGIVAVLFALFLLADIAPSHPVPDSLSSAPIVALTKPTVEDALREETMMADLAPLFLPTEYNAKPPDLPSPVPGKAFLDADPIKLTFADAAPRLAEKLPPVATLNGKVLTAAGPLDVIAHEATIPFAWSFGREETTMAPFPSHGGLVEVVATNTAEKMLAERLPIEARPPTDQLWQPLEFLAQVDAPGLVGPLELTTSSRAETVDNHFRKYLTQTLRLGARLPPGVYRIHVGP